MRRLLLATVVALVVAAPAQSARSQEVTIPSADGTTLAATLVVPSGRAPAGGWPGVVLMHGFGGTRASMGVLAQAAGLTAGQYAVLTFDARGHGQSTGLAGIGGPAEVADARAVFKWFAARPNVRDNRIGAFGISYGGATVLNSLAAGVPWAAVEVAETWSDLGSAMLPQGVAKSGTLRSLVGEIPAARLDPIAAQMRDDAVAGTNLGAVRTWAAQRSSLSRLRGRRTPVFLMQGRRDFAFGVDQAKRLYSVLKGPRRLWIGNLGHAPSSFPAADTTAMAVQAKQWFDRFLRGTRNGIETRKPIVLATQDKASVRTFAKLPPTGSIVYRGSLDATIAPDNSAIVRNPALDDPTEVFGSPVVKVTADARGGWSRIVATMVARTPSGSRIVVSVGAVPTSAGTRTYAIRLIDQVTKLPKGSTLEVTLSTSNEQYLDVAMPDTARLHLTGVDVTVPTLG